MLKSEILEPNAFDSEDSGDGFILRTTSFVAVEHSIFNHNSSVLHGKWTSTQFSMILWTIGFIPSSSLIAIFPRSVPIDCIQFRIDFNNLWSISTILDRFRILSLWSLLVEALLTRVAWNMPICPTYASISWFNFEMLFLLKLILLYFFIVKLISAFIFSTWIEILSLIGCKWQIYCSKFSICCHSFSDLC